jgi:hypothetical protein
LLWHPPRRWPFLGGTDAGVVELVDAPDSKSGSERSVGSIPTARTSFPHPDERDRTILASLQPVSGQRAVVMLFDQGPWTA